ncbi:accessory gene regulator B family protein [Clostridium chrysemydis]|uniref:accessory gene regulator B family protein n=1 Tax=Clostridium chrysemydis TaxID=2665504 RepID=UPI00188466D9
MIIIETLVNYQLDFLKRYTNISDLKTIDKMRYGLSFINSELSKFFILLSLAAVTNTLDKFLILILLLPIRSLIGGHHAKDYISCLLVSVSIYISLILLSFLFKDLFILVKVFGLTLFTLSVTFKKCINNPNRPKRTSSYIYKLRFYSSLIVLGFFIISNTLSNINSTFGFILIILLSFDFIFIKKENV